MGSALSNQEINTDDDFELVQNSETDLIKQVTRKMKVLDSLHVYYQDDDNPSIYTKYMVGTCEFIRYPYENDISRYKLISNVFVTLYQWPIDGPSDPGSSAHDILSMIL
jgi:hypothetical protein